MFPLPDRITVWNVAGNDGAGGLTYSAPVQYDARIAYKQEKFTDKNGDQLMSVAVCYSPGVEMLIDSQVLFSESVDASPPAAANDVRALSATPSGTDLKKAWFA